MQYKPEGNTSVLTPQSFGFHFVLNESVTREQHIKIQIWATNTPPPGDENAAAVTENSQNWVIRVLEKLQQEGIVTQAKVDEARAYTRALPHEQPRPPRTQRRRRQGDERKWCVIT